MVMKGRCARNENDAELSTFFPSRKKFKKLPQTLNFIPQIFTFHAPPTSISQNWYHLVFLAILALSPKLHILMPKTDTIAEIWNLPMIPNFELRTPCTTSPQFRPLCHGFLRIFLAFLPFWLFLGCRDQLIFLHSIDVWVYDDMTKFELHFFQTITSQLWNFDWFASCVEGRNFLV